MATKRLKRTKKEREETSKKILVLYNQGKGTKEIGKIFSLSPQVVYLALKKEAAWNPDFVIRHKEHDVKRQEEMEKLLAQGFTYGEIAKKYHLNRKTVWDIINTTKNTEPRYSKRYLKDILADRYDGYTINELSKKYGIPQLILRYYVDTDHFPKYFLED